ncbi:MAG: preprotein translocase subunit YajC [Bacteroidales bacterium]|nr:preprotein translocase subunit YajC [Bacteroidales bacterium]
MFSILLDAAPAATGAAAGAPAQPQGNAFMSFLPLILIIAIFYFFMIRPQQKRQKELNNFRNQLKKGDHVMTSSGLYAKVHEVKEQTLILEAAKDVLVEFDKTAVQPLVQNTATK